jgi:outer membrane immunogenic protein
MRAARGEFAMRSLLLSTILLFAFAGITMAQKDSDSGELAGSYNWVRANAGPGQCGCFGMNGGGISGSWNIRKGWSIAGDFSAEHNGNAPPLGSSLTLTSYLVGARYRFSQPWLNGEHKPQPFGELLLGVAHASGPEAGISNGWTQFASHLGGGVDVPLSTHFAVRVVQIDYYLTTFNNGTNNHQNNLLVGAGIVYHWFRRE